MLVHDVPKAAQIDRSTPGYGAIRIEVVALEDFAGTMERLDDRALAGTVWTEVGLQTLLA